MPEFKTLQGDACFRVPQRKKTSVVLIQSFKPTTVSDTRRQIEDYCNDFSPFFVVKNELCMVICRSRFDHQ